MIWAILVLVAVKWALLIWGYFAFKRALDRSQP